MLSPRWQRRTFAAIDAMILQDGMEKLEEWHGQNVEQAKKATKALARALELNDPAPKSPEVDTLDKHGRAERAMAARGARRYTHLLA